METFSALLAICAGNSPVSCEFPAQRPVTRSFDIFFDLYPNKRLSKQWWGWWFETISCPLWRHRNAQKCLYFVAYITKKIAFCLKKLCFIGPQNQWFQLKKGCFLSKIREKGVFFKLGYERGICFGREWEGRESIQNCRHYRADTIFKVKAEWPWKYRSKSKVITSDTPSDAN